MRNVISRRLAFYFMLSVMILLPYQTKAREIVGDVDGDGVVGLQEAIYALQVTSGSRPATIMDPDLTPQYSAWGTYTYSSGNITANFTFSNFIREGGPPPGEHVFQLSVIELSSTQMIVRDPGNNTQTWFRKMGSAGDVVGRWERTDGTSTFVFILDSDGSMHYSAYGDFLTKTVLVPNSTKVIDGNFSDWNSTEEIALYNTSGDCDPNSGKTIQKVYVSEDNNYIYIRMIVDGTPDPSFRFKFGAWFHIRVTPPPVPGIMIGSSVCGASFNNALIRFGNEGDGTMNQFECRFDKCMVYLWPINALSVSSDQDIPTICRETSRLPILQFDFSMCGE